MAEDLDAEQVKKLRLLDNKLNESAWDFDLIADEIGDLDFDGFLVDWQLPAEAEAVELSDGEGEKAEEREMHHCPKCGFTFYEK